MMSCDDDFLLTCSFVSSVVKAFVVLPFQFPDYPITQLPDLKVPRIPSCSFVSSVVKALVVLPFQLPDYPRRLLGFQFRRFWQFWQFWQSLLLSRDDGDVGDDGDPFVFLRVLCG
jgi:hypothetical protein